MISKDIVEILLDLERRHGASVVRCGCQEYVLRRTYAAEKAGKRKRISWTMKKNLYARQGGRCLSCGESRSISELEVDEFIPISRGGSTVKGNIRLLCGANVKPPCNQQKGNNDPVQEAKRTGVGITEQVRRQMSITLDEADLSERHLAESDDPVDRATRKEIVAIQMNEGVPNQAEIDAAQEKILPVLGEVKA